MTDPLPDPGTKVKHKGTGQPWIYQGKVDCKYNYYRFESDDGKVVEVPHANLGKYEVVEEVRQEGLDL